MSMVPKTLDPFAKAGSARRDTHALYKGASKPAVPSAAELGARFAALRQQEGLSLREVARRVDRSPSTIARFETDGKATAGLLLDLIRAMSSATGFVDAFLTPKFSDIREVARHARRQK